LKKKKRRTKERADLKDEKQKLHVKYKIEREKGGGWGVIGRGSGCRAPLI